VTVSDAREPRVLITARGYDERCRELDRLRTHGRERLTDLLRDARRDGGVDDNPVLVDLLEQRTQLERRIANLEEQLADAEIATAPRDGRAAVGTVVRVRDSGTGDVFEYELVGTIEGDPTNGRLSVAAPVGRALLGQERGGRVAVATPGGHVTLEVLAVDPVGRAVR